MLNYLVGSDQVGNRGTKRKAQKNTEMNLPTFKFEDSHKALMKQLMDCRKISLSTMPKDIKNSNDPDFLPLQHYSEGQIRYHLQQLRLKETLEKNDNRPSLCE